MTDTPATTEPTVSELADAVRAAAAEFNRASEVATKRGLLITIHALTLQTAMGDAPLLTVRVYEPT